MAGLHNKPSIAAASVSRGTGTFSGPNRRQPTYRRDRDTSAMPLPPRRWRTSSPSSQRSTQTSPERGRTDSSSSRRCLLGLKIVSFARTRAVKRRRIARIFEPPDLSPFDAVDVEPEPPQRDQRRKGRRYREFSAQSRSNARSSRAYRGDETRKQRRTARRREHIAALLPVEVVEIPGVTFGVRHDGEHVAGCIEQPRAPERRAVGHGGRIDRSVPAARTRRRDVRRKRSH